MQSDSFLAFVAKALLVLRQSMETNKLRVLTTAAVRFNGAPPSRAMITGILMFEDKLTPYAIECLHVVERKFGREVLTSGYHKLTRICAICAAAVPVMLEWQSTLLEYVLDYLRWGLVYELIDGNTISEDTRTRTETASLDWYTNAWPGGISPIVSLGGLKIWQKHQPEPLWPQNCKQSSPSSRHTGNMRWHFPLPPQVRVPRARIQWRT